MKKFFITTLVAVSLFATTQAQNATPTTDAATAKPTMSKAERDAAKAKKEADLTEAFVKAGASKDEEKKARAVLDASNEATKPIKADAGLGEDEKKEKLDAIYSDRNEQLKVILGKEKYKAFKATQKAQKEAAGQ